MFSVVLDTCALYPQYLRDTLLVLASPHGPDRRGLFTPFWTADIVSELRRSLILHAGLDDDRADRMLASFRSAFSEHEVTGYESLIDFTTSPDLNDRHVLAAAVRSRASAIVTFNLRHFPPESVEPLEIEVLHPDRFLLDLLDLAPRRVVDALTQRAAEHKREPKTIYGLLDALERAGVPEFADEVRRLLD